MTAQTDPTPATMTAPVDLELPWWRAATVAERASLAHPTDAPEQPRWPFWQGHPWTSDTAAVRARLAALGLTATEFRSLLCADADHLAGRIEAPEWCRWFTEDRAIADRPAETSDWRDAMGFLDPFLAGAQLRLRDRLTRWWREGDRPAELHRLPELAAAQWPVHRVSVPALQVALLEFHVARERGELPGTRRQQWREFSERIGNVSGRAELWREYPGLVRYVIEIYARWAEQSWRFASRLIADWATIRERGLVGPDPGELLAVTSTADMSRARGPVRILLFERARLVYKPRSLSPEVGFSAVLDWFNGGDPRHDLRSPVLCGAEEHGWMEYVTPDPCRDRDQVDAFYWRAGALTALVHVLRGVDVNAGNVIAAGAHPMLIDLETLLTPAPPTGSGPATEQDEMMSSVLSAGLVPANLLYRDPDGVPQPFENRGFSDTTGQPAAVRGLMPGRDEDGCPTVVWQRSAPRPRDNLPVLSGRRVPLAEHEESYVAGFKHAMRAVMDDRDGFRRGPLESFSGAVTRYLLRPSWKHQKLLASSMHPNLLRDGRDRGVLLDRLWQSPAEGPGHPAIVASEVDALQQGVVPDYAIRAGHRSFGLPGGAEIPGYWPASPVELVRRRVMALSEPEVRRQSATLRRAIATVRPGAPDRPAPVPVTAAPPSQARLREAIGDVVDSVMDAATRLEAAPSWLTLDLVDDRIWTHRAINPGFFSGLSGIGCFLAYAGHLTRTAGALRVAERIADHLARAGQPAAGQLDAGVGIGWGSGGITYFLATMTVLTGDGRWLPALERLGRQSTQMLAQRQPPDLIGGAAGSLLAGMAARRMVPAAVADAHLRAAEQARLTPAGGDGPPEREPDRSLFRGSSGVRLALGRLVASGSAGDPATLERLTHLGGRGDQPAAGGWGWGWGRVGVAASWLALIRCQARGQHRAELDRERAVIEAAVLGTDTVDVGDFSLDRGQLGALELLRQIADIEQDRTLAGRVRRRLATVVDHGLASGWSSSAPGGLPHPGFVSGSSGIGYALLCAAFPGRLPDILTFDAPGTTN